MFPAMRPEDFIAKWRATTLNERQGAHSFFNDLCALVGHPAPAEYEDSDVFAFEKTGARRVCRRLP